MLQTSLNSNAQEKISRFRPTIFSMNESKLAGRREELPVEPLRNSKAQFPAKAIKKWTHLADKTFASCFGENTKDSDKRDLRGGRCCAPVRLVDQERRAELDRQGNGLGFTGIRVP